MNFRSQENTNQKREYHINYFRMEETSETLKDYLVQNDIELLRILINALIKEHKWPDIVELLKTSTESLYKKHWLKTHQMVLSIFELTELLGVDCDIFSEMNLIAQPEGIENASDLLFENLIQLAMTQFRSGGSTLFFNVDKISTTRFAIIIPELIEARYRETIFILSEFDEMLQTLTKEWIEAARLWRRGYGFQLLRARNHRLLIHVKECKVIRNLLAKELGIDLKNIAEEKDRLIRENNSDYLQLSQELDVFVLSYIISLGVIGKFDPKYRALIDPGDSDEF